MNFDWQEFALCRGHNPDLFYPEDARNITDQARELCANCPVQPACLQHAIINKELGMWGGMTESERGLARRRYRTRPRTIR